MKTKELKEIDKVSFKNVNGNLDGDYITLIGGVENKLYYAVERYSGKPNEKVPVTTIHFEEVVKKMKMKFRIAKILI